MIKGILHLLPPAYYIYFPGKAVQIVAGIHAHSTTTDAMSEKFSGGTIANGGKGDEYIMSVLGEMDHYLLTPKGKLIRRDKNWYRDYQTAFYNKNGKFEFGPGFVDAHRTNDDLLPMTSTEADDPTLEGKATYPWIETALPKDLKPTRPKSQSNAPTPNCIGCYEEAPLWLKKSGTFGSTK
jgi:hypothetical protein